MVGGTLPLHLAHFMNPPSKEPPTLAMARIDSTEKTLAMVVNIRLSKRRSMDSTDTMGRPWVGWDADATDEELWNNNRGRYGFGPRVEEEQYASLSYQGTIRVVAAIAGRVSMPKPSSTQAKWALLGEVLVEGDPVRDALVGQPVAPARGFTYIEDPVVLESSSLTALDASGQGWMQDSEKRKLVEDAAQDRLTRHYQEMGWTVDDTRFGNPFDACATRGDELLYLEAKGTTTAGGSVIVTRNEVAWARGHPGECVIGILSDMEFDDDGNLDASDGAFRVFKWEPEEYELNPISFDWRPPERKQIAQPPSATAE